MAHVYCTYSCRVPYMLHVAVSSIILPNSNFAVYIVPRLHDYNCTAPCVHDISAPQTLIILQIKSKFNLLLQLELLTSTKPCTNIILSLQCFSPCCTLALAFQSLPRYHNFPLKLLSTFEIFSFICLLTFCALCSVM